MYMQGENVFIPAAALLATAWKKGVLAHPYGRNLSRGRMTAKGTNEVMAAQ